MAIRLGLKKSFIPGRISPENKNIVYSQKIQIDQCILCLIFAKTAANNMRYCIYFVMVHDGRADSYCPGSFPYVYFFKPAIRLFFEHGLTTVIGNIDERGFKLHQGIEMIVNSTDAF